MSKEREPMNGPKLALIASCRDCAHCKSERYVHQGDSGCDVFCTANGGQRLIGDTTWATPEWCPFLSRAKAAFLSAYADKTTTKESKG